MADATISIYLDTRRIKEGNEREKKSSRDQPPLKPNGLYPVKLRVYYDYQTRFYPTGIDLSKEAFEHSYLAKKPRGDENRELKIRIAAIEAKANQVKEELKTFSFDKFEKALLRPAGAKQEVFYHYEQVIGQLKKEERLNTASNYALSARSIKTFLAAKKQKAGQLSFEAITVSFLKEYEEWMLQSGKEKTTVGIYLRPLRALFNTVIAEGEISKRYILLVNENTRYRPEYQKGLKQTGFKKAL